MYKKSVLQYFSPISVHSLTNSYPISTKNRRLLFPTSAFSLTWERLVKNLNPPQPSLYIDITLILFLFSTLSFSRGRNEYLIGRWIEGQNNFRNDILRGNV